MLKDWPDEGDLVRPGCLKQEKARERGADWDCRPVLLHLILCDAGAHTQNFIHLRTALYQLNYTPNPEIFFIFE